MRSLALALALTFSASVSAQTADTASILKPNPVSVVITVVPWLLKDSERYYFVTSKGYGQEVLLYVPEGSWKFLVEIKSDGGLYWGDTSSNYRTYSGGSFFGANTGSFFTLIKTGSGAGTAHVAGTLNTTFTNNGGLGDTPSLGAAFILGQYPGLFYNGKMAEIIISSYSWDTSERQQVEGYLAHKWGLTSSLPNDHPYKSTAP